MSSGELTPNDQRDAELTSAEINFALVLARMIDSVGNDPGDLRQAVYDLARYKLQEQFTDADAGNIKRSRQALESAIRGVEAFSQQHGGVAVRIPPRRLIAAEAVVEPHAAETMVRARVRRVLPAAATPGLDRAGPDRQPLHMLARAVAMVAVLVIVAVAVQQRERLWSLVRGDPAQPLLASAEPARPPAASPQAAVPVAAKPARLLPTEYGVYAVLGDKFVELPLLPGRAPDPRVAVSTAITAPVTASLPTGHPKFIVFRRDVATSIPDRAEVRVIAKISRFNAAGRPAGGDDTWVMRNISFPYRSAPFGDNPEMYEIHSENLAAELTPGRYAVVFKGQAYDFSIAGRITDPRQCLEKIEATNGTFYAECKKP